MNAKLFVGVSVFAALGAVPVNVHAATQQVGCKYITGLHAVIMNLNNLVHQMPKLSSQQAHSQGLAVDLQFAHFDRKATPLPVDLNRAFAATVQNLEDGAAFRERHNTDQYNHFYNQTHKYLTATWSAYQKHYGNAGCKKA